MQGRARGENFKRFFLRYFSGRYTIFGPALGYFLDIFEGYLGENCGYPGLPLNRGSCVMPPEPLLALALLRVS